MNFRSSVWRWFRLLFAIHGWIGVVAGYWDMRLSDAWIYHGQMARIHDFRTLQLHLLLGAAAAGVLSVWMAYREKRQQQEIERGAVIPGQIALALSSLLFLILGIKLHLVWLQTHLTDPEGLLWTGVLAAGAVLLYFAARMIVRRIYVLPSSGMVAAVAFLVTAAATSGDLFLHQRSSHSGKAGTGPNVLLIVADTLRWDHVSAYGYPRKTTPNLDQLAAEGALYETAISTSPWTTPSHAAMFTGQYPTRNGVDGQNIFLNPASTTLAELLTAYGFQTAGFINNVYIRRQTGLGKGFQQYEEFWGRNECASLPLLWEMLHEQWSPRKDTGASETTEAVNQWLNKDWTGRNPFFLFVHYMEPHAPYGVPDPSRFLPPGVSVEQARAVNQDPEKYICGKLPMTGRDFEILDALYDSDIFYMDSRIGQLLDLFRNRGILDNTLVIFVSDHGEHFGDHGLMSHELSIYDSLVRVPLILRYPAAIRPGTRIAPIVQTVDLFPSILEFLNLPARALDLQGISLLPSALAKTSRPFAFSEYNNSRAVDKIERRFPGASNPVFRRKTLTAVRATDWKLILGDDGTRELYDMKADPGETANLYSSEADKARLLEEVVRKWKASFKASRYFKKEDISREAQEELKALGYIQ